MRDHTTFRVGGPADVYARPAHRDDVIALIAAAGSHGVPWFVLGGGANILVADAGIRGIVIDMRSIAHCSHHGTTLAAGAGLPVSDAAAYAADHGLAGLDFIYSMPGSIGGAVWMNARCYDGEIYPILDSVEIVTPDGACDTYNPRREDFDYKRSPFMTNSAIMTEVTLRLDHGDPEQLWRVMREHEADRCAKGHFIAPCAGSVFKNNRAFGSPSGAIIDGIGMRGTTIGGAKVSDLHANIVINTGNATATDIRRLIERIHDEVERRLGYDLEPEVLYVGDWGSFR